LPGANVKVEMTQIGSVLDAVYQDADQMVQELSGNDGSVMLQLVRNSNYSVAVDKPEYTSATRQATTNQLKTPENFTVAIKKTNYGCRVVGKVVEEGTNTPIANASVQVKNTATGQMTSLTADASGGFQSMVECGQSYEFTATQQNFEGGNATVSVAKEDCKVAEKQVTLELGPALVVMLEPIFFDFDRYYIRNIDAIPTMDSLVIIMNYYPSLHVKLTGACDSRGPVSYNDILAQKRAASAKKYLMGKGISENRITTAAVGDRGLVNKCDDKTPCSEAQHQLNRRVDVSATQSNEKGVLFKTRPIEEMKVITRFRP
jgi:outer membrane protein OmpA-like peptidoglycan-associated protein